MNTILTDYQKLIHQVIGPLLPYRCPVAIFDFPSYCNVGDNAIWLGESEYLKSRHPDSPVVWVANTSSVENSLLPRLPSDCVILIQGGGNFGDLWPHHQMFRERLVKQYRDHRIIQFPQSIHFKEKANFERCRKVLSEHPDFHLIVRDQVSLRFAHELNHQRAYLCPDMALQLDHISRKASPKYEIFALMRDDIEKSSGSEYGALAEGAEDCVVADWRDQKLSGLLGLEASLCELLTRYPRKLRLIHQNEFVQKGLKHHFDSLARSYLVFGCGMLESGRVVITDRLHAHILCCLMGIPHIVLDNSYKKIQNLRDAWHTGEGLCQSASTWDEAIVLARSLIR